MKPSKKFQWRLNHYASLVFIVVIFCAVNVIGFKKHFRKDFSINRYLTLSPQTLNLIRHLPGKVTIYFFIAEEPDALAGIIKDDVDSLLREYQYQSPNIAVQNVNPFTNLEETQKIAQRFKLSTNEDVLIIAYGEQSRVLKVSELATMDSSGLIYGEPPKVRTFNAEAEISGAIMSLVQGKPSKIYFITGHGEPDPDTAERDLTGLSIVKDRIKGQNCDLQKLSLADAGKIPDDANIVMIVGPKYLFTADEIANVHAYLARNGRLVLFLDPQTKTGLETLLESYGVTFNDDLILRPIVALTTSGLAQAVSMEAVGSAFAAHPAISWIKPTGSELPLGACRSIRVNEASEKLSAKNPTDVTVLIQTSDKAWGETRVADFKKETPIFDAKTDHAGPLNLAVSIDSGAVQGGQVNLQGVKIIAVGSSSFLLNKYIGSLQADFLINAMNWMLEKKESLGITPKAPKEFSLTMTDVQRQSLATVTLIIIPLLGVLVGMWIAFRRRR